MNDNTARETQPSDQPTEQKGHILSLPLENLQTDREPHSYERWMIARISQWVKYTYDIIWNIIWYFKCIFSRNG